MLSTALLCLVVAITDGDTLKARCPTADDAHPYEQVKVRLSAIDAPEKAQPFGRRSRQHLAELCFQVEAKITPKTKDRYGRTVADVECRGQDAGKAQVQAGMAWVYDRYSKGYEALYQLQDEARTAGLGLWSHPGAVAPWEWRKLPRGQR